MNPGPVEEVGKVATGFIESMKSQPLALALVVMNFTLLVFFWWILDTVAKTAEKRQALVAAEQHEIRELLVKCIVPEKT
jgi:hypothetical protein